MNTSPRSFYDSPAWLRARQTKLLQVGARCECCGQSSKDGSIIEVHHIKSRDKFPQLALEVFNLQVLCRHCHMGLHWIAWGIKNGAANDPTYAVRRAKPVAPQQLSLWDAD